MTQKRKFIKKGELIAIIAVLIISVVLLVLFKYNDDKKQGYNVANIYVFDELYKQVVLEENKEKQTFVIDASLEVTIVCEKGEIYFYKSQCPDKVCIHAGKLSKKHQSAACLPAKVSIVIT